MSGLQITGVYKSFGTLPVLRGVDLEIKSGTFCSILGPSGSGKTTLLRVIAGFEQADRGSIVLDDVILEDATHSVSPDRRRIGYVPQDGSLFPHLSIAANVAFGLERKDRKSQRVAELLAMVGLEGLERRYPHQLSGGQQQRVALARALAIEPALVLLDEPFSSLDASLRESVRHDVRRVLAEAGSTVLLVTHDQDEALSLSDEVAVIEEGQIGQADSPVRLYSTPSTPAVARGLGQANLLRGSLGDGSTVRTALGVLSLDNAASLNGAKAKPGESLIVLVRPEQIALQSPPSSEMACARVIEREYYGHDAIVRVRGSWDDTTLITVRLADATVLPEVGELVGLAVRGQVIGWPVVAEHVS